MSQEQGRTDLPQTGLRGDYAEQWSHLQGGILIYASAECCVRIDERGRIDWETSRDYDLRISTEAKYNVAAKGDILDELAVMETAPCQGLSEEQMEHYRRLLGEAVRSMLHCDYEAARRGLMNAKHYYGARTGEVTRDWYLMGSFLTAVPFVVCGPVFWAYRVTLRQSLGVNAFWLLMATCAGALGALLSVIVRMGKLSSDPSAGQRLHKLEGCARIIAGAISGLVVALAIRADFVLSNLSHGANLPYVLLLGALVGGCGERLASSIISRLDGPAGSQQGGERK